MPVERPISVNTSNVCFGLHINRRIITPSLIDTNLDMLTFVFVELNQIEVLQFAVGSFIMSPT